MKLFEFLMWLNSESEHPSTGVPVHLEIAEGELKELTYASFDGTGIVLHTTEPPLVENEIHDHS